MTDLVRRAILGDAQAQKECTAQGIALPCPCCGESPNFTSDHFLPIFDIGCKSCGVKIGPWQESEHNLALAAWNTRTKPPIGECGTCADRQKCEFGGIFETEGVNGYCPLYKKADNEQV